MKPDYPALIGKTFNRLTVVETLHRNARYEMLLLCSCSCGGSVTVPYPRLKSGNTKSCGCLQPEVVRSTGRAQRTHGGSNTPTYETYRSMIDRCYNPNTPGYAYWGGRGITVCPQWLEGYAAFKRDMGTRPKGKTLDRYPNNDGNYEPGNCRWATPSEQGRNTRATRYLTIQGVTKPLIEWSEEFSVCSTTILDRLHRGWPVEEAIRTPAHSKPLFEFNGRFLSLTAIAKEVGMKPGTLRTRIRSGVPLTAAIANRVTTHEMQNRGRLYEHQGVSLTLVGWSKESGVAYPTLHARLKAGWTLEDAITEPLQFKNYKAPMPCRKSL